MQSISKITTVNLVIMLVYSGMIRASSGSEKGLYILIISAGVIAVHIFILLMISVILYIQKKRVEGRAVLLSTGLVLLIGFSSCWANASI